MPTILIYEGYRFFFYSNEGDPREPCHVHVRKGEAIAKFWIQPEISLAESYAMTSKELSKLFEIVKKNKSLIEERWDGFFSA